MEKSANKRWRESGTSLSFKEWIERENKKKEQGIDSFIKNTENSVFEEVSNDVPQYTRATGNEKTNFLGLNRTILVVSTLLIVSATGFYLYKKYKK